MNEIREKIVKRLMSDFRSSKAFIQIPSNKIGKFEADLTELLELYLGKTEEDVMTRICNDVLNGFMKTTTKAYQMAENMFNININ